MRGFDTVKQVVSRYRHFDLEYAALRVVGRGLFLAVMLMVAYLFVFTRVTDLIVGTNEVLIPTTVVNPDIDLGALAQGSFSRTSASVVSVIGVVTLIVSALFTAHALRQGSHRALMGDSATPVRLLSVRTIALALVLAIAIFATWLLTLTTSIRHRAWVSLLGGDVSTLAVDVGKGVAVFASLLIVWAGVLTVVRFTFDRVTRRAVVAAVIVAMIVVVANFFLLYTYVGALINPAVSAGIVLVFALLLWVNICVRTYLGALCWVGAPPR
jgi:uncharacterized BrkB/YihY/UPF0761 family membrane protein